MNVPQPWIEAFAPATLTNLGPGFGCLGLAFTGPGAWVRARISPQAGVYFSDSSGTKNSFSHNDIATKVATAVATLLHQFAPDKGIELQLKQGLPTASGLGSISANICAALLASDSALGLGLNVTQLVDVTRNRHSSLINMVAALLGGIILINSGEPLGITSLPIPEHLWLAVYTPSCPDQTKQVRQHLPKQLYLDEVTTQTARLGLWIHALHCGDLPLLGETMIDAVVEPLWAALLPSYLDVKATCLEAGALACGISGFGPTTFALCSRGERAQALLEIMAEIYTLAKIPGQGWATQVSEGARLTGTLLH